MSKTFSEIKIGAEFFCNGNNWIKMSSRTARMPAHQNLGSYYFKWDTKVALPTNKEPSQ